LAGWWTAINTAGVALSFAAEGFVYYARPNGGSGLFFNLIVLISMGVLQVIVCCCLVSLNGSRNKTLQITLGLISGVLTAFLIPILGMLVIYVTALLAVLTLLPSGIIFGWLLGLSRWRSLRPV
jgi:hypothetical protein